MPETVRLYFKTRLIKSVAAPARVKLYLFGASHHVQYQFETAQAQKEWTNSGQKQWWPVTKVLALVTGHMRNFPNLL